ncbi:ATP-binding protein [Pseudalkalibacillus hwajinpoensis]|uniref:histidine kinase n=1 Tax=Guptibacillus hwajinpoensis TaxID=208199 RepID=A0A4U1MPM2_9BACL|nr:sensor histidine kinase [Pseudalkalibacillus hwajinpoensis]TKD72480.1 sensor histidine kinase [Pseudalkalibacillus hwajinpoensis]
MTVRIPIKTKIMILSFGVVFFSIIIAGIIASGKIYEENESDLGDRGLITGRIVANLPEVQQYLLESEGWNRINPIVNRIRTINGADYIVVLDLNRIRYSHPVEEKLGTVSSGKDEGAAFAEHSYVSKAQGDMGMAIRSFVPIMNDQHEQIGVVLVGHMLPSLTSVLLSIESQLILITLLSLGFGMIGSWLLARQIKKETFQLEPYEISRLLVERTATFQAMNEGVIAINLKGEIMIFNDKAKSILGVVDDAVGRAMRDVLISPKLLSILTCKDAFDREEVTSGNKVLVISKVPICVENETVGAVAVFQDRTEVARMAEELTGVKNFVDALRVQNHESMNRLHTIAGLIQLDEKEKALNYVFDVSQRDEELSGFLSKRIKDYRLSGLLISKVKRAKELGINLTITQNSRLETLPYFLDSHDIVLIIGNLIENAFHSFEEIDRNERIIEVSLLQDDDLFLITVEDNGCGVPEKMKEKIMTKGFTTKGEKGSGLGLYLVKHTIDKGNGKMNFISHEGEGTSIELDLPMKREEAERNDGRRSIN